MSITRIGKHALLRDNPTGGRRDQTDQLVSPLHIDVL